jgi:GntR family transcriptional regulator
VRNAIAVLRSEGLVVTEKGSGTRVRELPARDQVHLLLGDTVICRMPTDLERRRLEPHLGVPVLVVSRVAGRTEYFAGDRVVLVA